MTSELEKRGRPRGLLRALARAPIWLFRAHMGWLGLGHFILLEDVGRRSGLPRRVVLEVVAHESDGGYVVASGWGESSDWYRNVMADPHVHVVGGVHRRAMTAARLSPSEAATELAGYARHHPRALVRLARLMLGKDAPTSANEAAVKLADVIPLIRLTPAG